jgi:hypothetical protein
MGPEPLRFPFVRAGYRHVLLAQVDRWCVVERTWIEDGKPHLPHFEVVHLRVDGIRPLPDGTVTTPHEAYPAPRDWGRKAWSEPTLVHTRQRWERLRGDHPDLSAWTTLGIPDDPEGYRAWKEGRLQTREAPAPTRGIPSIAQG